MSSVSIDPNIYLTPSDALISFIKSQDLVDPPESIAAASNDSTVKLSVDDVKWLSSRFPDLAPSMLLSCSVHLPCRVVSMYAIYPKLRQGPTKMCFTYF